MHDKLLSKYCNVINRSSHTLVGTILTFIEIILMLNTWLNKLELYEKLHIYKLNSNYKCAVVF